MTKIIPIILSGGAGTRLWPISRRMHPKPFMEVAGKPLLAHAMTRATAVADEALIVTNQDHYFLTENLLKDTEGVPAVSYLLEPKGRNTAPAIALAVRHIQKVHGNETVCLVLAADHLISDEAAFEKAVGQAAEQAQAGNLVVFGIRPTAPETGYGYIEAAESLQTDTLTPVPIARFVEKPDQATAEQFLASGRFTWNSGMFLFRASAMLSELERLAPEVVSCCRAALEQDVADLDFLRLEREAFAKCPNVAIDVAVMEQTQLGSVIPLAAGWSDVGSWSALWETADRDDNGNVLRGRVISEGSRNCYLRSEHRLVVGLGVENLVVVETDDAVLIAERGQAQNVKTIVKQLEAEGSPEGKAHRKIYRPWGHYTGVVEDSRWQVKRISVKPGASLSLQMHHHRAEHWIVVSGTAVVERDGETQLVGENQSTYIPLGCKHRLTNPGRIPVELIEVQSGAYLGEDDIVRFDDVYGRSNRAFNIV